MTGPLGPDATEADLERFRSLLARCRGTLKGALMDQRLIAGLGNLMVDEIAWRRVDPRTPVPRLSRRRVERLWRAMEGVVCESLPTGRVPTVEGWLTGARDERRDARCPRCGARLRRATVAGRTTVWCPREQR